MQEINKKNEKDINSEPKQKVEDAEYKVLTEGQLKWRRFLKHKVAVGASVILIMMYIMVLFANFFAPHGMLTEYIEYIQMPPMINNIRFVDHEGQFSIRPFFYEPVAERDPTTLRFVYTEDYSQKHYISFFVRGEPYVMLGFIESDLHFLGSETGELFLLGTDQTGRCVLSRIIFGGRVSLSIGLVGVIILVIVGTLLGAISGYFSGKPDWIIQRIIEVFRTIPQIALFMSLSAILPPRWPSTWVFLGIVIILGLVGWTGLARELRGKILAIRKSDFILAAEITGARTSRIIFRHVIPNVLSHIIVIGTLSIPMMIIAETSLSFLGLGIRPPMTSWGALLGRLREVHMIRYFPWLLFPVLFMVVAVLCYNFIGDALRDVADPYSK